MVSKKASFSLVIYISRTKTKQNGEVPVLMKININGERAVMQLQRSIHPDNRDRASGRLNEANEFNRYIESLLTVRFPVDSIIMERIILYNAYGIKFKLNFRFGLWAYYKQRRFI